MFEDLFSNFLDWVRSVKGTELDYVFLLFFLFVIPRLLLRFAVPMALTAFAMGIFCGVELELYQNDPVVSLFASLGIISLFLFAGLEVDIDAIFKNYKPLAEHLVIGGIGLALFSYAFHALFSLNWAASIVLGLAVSTPSTGFILDTLDTSDIADEQKYWVKLKAISSELVALGMLFVLVQRESLTGLAGSTLLIVGLVATLPWLFRRLTQVIEKYAPGSEFSFLLMMAVILGIVTKKLGAYYLVGAFLVGLVAGQVRKEEKDVTTEEFLKSFKLFSSFFMPFYFFYAGLGMTSEMMSWDSLMVAGLLFGISAPLRVLTVTFHRKLSLKEAWQKSLPIAISLMPTLIFGLVLADILKNKFGFPPYMYGGLVLYTLLITAIPPFILKFLPESENLKQLTIYDQIVETHRGGS